MENQSLESRYPFVRFAGQHYVLVCSKGFIDRNGKTTYDRCEAEVFDKRREAEAVQSALSHMMEEALTVLPMNKYYAVSEDGGILEGSVEGEVRVFDNAADAHLVAVQANLVYDMDIAALVLEDRDD